MSGQLKALNERKICRSIFLVCLAFNFYFSLEGWNHSLREFHESRQVQTALVSRCLQEEGWQVDYPYPIFGPPWSVPFEFPVYQQITAWVSSLTGCALEQSGRAVSLVFLYLALPAVFLLQDFLPIPSQRRWLLPGLVLISPVYLYYSRCFMIESTAFCCALWFLLAWARAARGDHGLWIFSALLLGPLAGLIKSTTLVVYLATAGLLVIVFWRRLGNNPNRNRDRVMLLFRAFMFATPAVIATYVWTRHADAVKASNPLAEIFTSARLREFIFGVPGQIFTGAFWSRILEQTCFGVLHPINAGALVFVAVLFGRGIRLATISLTLCFLAGPLVFPNLYVVHDYYFYASGLLILAALGVAWSALLDMKRLPLTVRYLLVCLSLALQVADYLRHFEPIQVRRQEPEPELTRVLREVTTPQDVVLTYGQDWNPLLAYYSHRRFVMVVGAAEAESWRRDEVLRRLEPGQPAALILTGESRHKTPLTSNLPYQLGLDWKPAAENVNTLLFLRRDSTTGARIAGMTLSEFGPLRVPAETAAIPRHNFANPTSPDTRFAANFHPAPEMIIHPFGLGIADYEGHLVIDAHAPTDVYFSLPPSSSTLSIEFGIKSTAYTNGTETDGVEFRVEIETATGVYKVLYDEFLNPMQNPAHRALQKTTIAIPADARGRLWFRTLPGPSNNMTSDHAYWARIELK